MFQLHPVKNKIKHRMPQELSPESPIRVVDQPSSPRAQQASLNERQQQASTENYAELEAELNLLTQERDELLEMDRTHARRHAACVGKVVSLQEIVAERDQQIKTLSDREHELLRWLEAQEHALISKHRIGTLIRQSATKDREILHLRREYNP